MWHTATSVRRPEKCLTDIAGGVPLDRSHPTPTRAWSASDSAPYGSRIETPVRWLGLCLSFARILSLLCRCCFQQPLPTGSGRVCIDIVAPACDHHGLPWPP